MLKAITISYATHNSHVKSLLDPLAVPSSSCRRNRARSSFSSLIVYTLRGRKFWKSRMPCGTAAHRRVKLQERLNEGALGEDVGRAANVMRFVAVAPERTSICLRSTVGAARLEPQGSSPPGSYPSHVWFFCSARQFLLTTDRPTAL